MIYFPTDIAIALTGIVHLLNNIFKLVLVGRNADKATVLNFGIAAVIAAFLGAALLILIPDEVPAFSYEVFGRTLHVYSVKLLISILLISFALMDLFPILTRLQIEKKHLLLGGLLSGFFGGLSGNQGALRSAFLIKAGLSKEAFVATGVVVSCMVDFSRLFVYSKIFSGAILMANLNLIIVATLSASAGAYLGNRLLKKVTIDFVQKLVAVLLILISLALGLGIL
jgi:uncharacterized membrane protein YfcA